MSATNHPFNGQTVPPRKNDIINVDIIGPHQQGRTTPSGKHIINVDIIGP